MRYASHPSCGFRHSARPGPPQKPDPRGPAQEPGPPARIAAPRRPTAPCPQTMSTGPDPQPVRCVRRPRYLRTTKNPRSGSLRDRGSSVREGGVEPPRPFGHWNLNPARLPIPPPAHGCCRSILSPVIRAVRSGSSAGAPFDMENISTLQGVLSHPFPAGHLTAVRRPPPGRRPGRLPAPRSNAACPGSYRKPCACHPPGPAAGIQSSPSRQYGARHKGPSVHPVRPQRPRPPGETGSCGTLSCGRIYDRSQHRTASVGNLVRGDTRPLGGKGEPAVFPTRGYDQ